jgi:hypothetical protein
MSISFKILVSGQPVEKEYPICISVRSKRAHITWRQKVQDNDVQLAYLEAPKIVSHEAIELIDYCSELIESPEETVYTSNSSVIYSDKENLIFTTFTKMTEYGIEPLFFGHSFPSTLKSGNVPGLFLWNKSTDLSAYTYDNNYRVLISDIKNEIDYSRGIYRGSYVTYETEKDGVTKNITETFKGEILFKEKTIYDVVGVPGELHAVYMKEKVENNWKFTFPYVNGQTIYYKQYNANKEILKVSENIHLKYQWPLEINRPDVKVNCTPMVGDPYSKVYNWKNPKDIFYFPYYPYITYKKEGNYLNSYCFVVPHKNIILDKERNLNFTFKVIRNGITVLAQTTKTNLIGKRLSGSFKDKNIVNYEEFNGGLDYSLGVVTYTQGIPLMPDDFIVAEYIVKDEYLEKEIYNINPIHERWLLEGPLAIYCTQNQADGYSQIHVAKLKESWYAGTGNKSLVLVETTESNIPYGYVGDSFLNFIQDKFIYNPFTKKFKENDDSGRLLLGIVNFKKNMYLDKVEHKDLRVYPGIKSDLAIEKKGRDFLFSNILNPTDQYHLDLDNQVLVLVDRTELPDYGIVSIENEIKGTLAAGFIPHIHNKDFPIIKSVKVVDNEMTITVKESSSLFNKLLLYHNTDRIIHSETAPLLYETDPLDYTVSNGTITYTFPITLPVSALSNLPQSFFVKWASEEYPALFSAVSPIFSALLISSN